MMIEITIVHCRLTFTVVACPGSAANRHWLWWPCPDGTMLTARITVRMWCHVSQIGKIRTSIIHILLNNVKDVNVWYLLVSDSATMKCNNYLHITLYSIFAYWQSLRCHPLYRQSSLYIAISSLSLQHDNAVNSQQLYWQKYNKILQVMLACPQATQRAPGPVQAGPGQARLGQARPGQARPGQMTQN